MTKHLGALAVAWEVALTVTCLRPAVEVWRIGRGGAHDPRAPVDPNSAMMFGKICERVFEGCPGAVLTAVTLLLHADARSQWALTSIILACVTTAYVATTVVYNYDTSAAARRMMPAFRGYAPLGVRPGIRSLPPAALRRCVSFIYVQFHGHHACCQGVLLLHRVRRPRDADL